MNDPARFGMAKSFFMMGQSAGFDMTKQEDMDSFVKLYNAGLSPEREGVKESWPSVRDTARIQKATSGKKKLERKKRKIANAARKVGRKKRK